MRCPKCKQAELDATSGECPKCGFHGDAASLEALAHINWLLGEMGKWMNLGFSIDVINRLRRYYTDRQKETEVKLGLRLAPFAPTEALEGWGQLLRYEALSERMKIWRVAGHIKDGDVFPDYSERAAILRQRLEGYNRPQYSATWRERLDVVLFIIEAIPTIQQADAFTSPEAEQKVKAALQAEKENLEVLLGLRAVPQVESSKSAAPVAPVKPIVPPPPAVPAQPIGERLRRSILSERTLQALIFLGIFLLFTAAISFIISGWDGFSPALRIGIPVLFTTIFIVLGWLVRTKTKLYRSGIALIAIGALLVPIDAYTIYVTQNWAQQNWAQFWVIASIFSLLFYVFLTLQIQSRFFGYLVAVAAGSLILAGMEVVGLPRDGYGAGLSVLALGMLFAATGIARGPVPERLRVFIDPFRYIALWLPAVLMPLTMGQWLVTHRAALDALQAATTITWFLGGFVFGWGAVRYRSVGLGRLAALALPVAVFMGQLALFNQFGIHRAWHAFGLACLTPLYLFTAYKLSMQSIRKLDPILVEHADTASAAGWLMVVIAAIFSLFDLTSSAPAAATHLVLAASIALSAILWKRPRTLYLASFFALTASSFLMTELHFKLNQLGIGWASLAILYLFLALWLARFERGKPFLSTLVITAYVFAALAILPAIVLYDGGILAYTLGNFIALSAWGASFAYRQRDGFYVASPAEGIKKPAFYGLLKNGAIFHWFAALPLPFWLWTAVTTWHPADFSLALALAALAGGMVAASHWLCFAGDECRRPWRFVGLLVSVAAPLVAFSVAFGGYTPSITVFAAGLLYFADAFASRKSVELYPAGLVTAWGLGLLLEHANVDGDVLTFALCLLIGIYLLCGLLAERRKLSLGTPRFLAPLYHTAHIVGYIVLVRIYFQPLNAAFYGPAWTDPQQLWGAADQLFLAALYTLFAWGRYSKPWAYISVWLAAAGGAFLAAMYSSGQGSLAAKAALIVIALILAERILYRLKHTRKVPSRRRAYLKLAWGLYHQPLLFTGWMGSIAVIGLALVRNYYMLGGGRVQQIWAAVALLLITALYAFSARLFKQPRFVWFAVSLIFIPWTILANLGWFIFLTPAPSEFAISWMALAWAYFLVSLLVRRFAPKAYVTPLTTAARLLTPLCLLWAVADVSASRYTVGMAIVLYAMAAWEDHRQNRINAVITPFAATKFLYPTLALFPLWSVYWLKFLQPAARHEHFGLLLLGFGALGLLVGKLLERLAPRADLTRAYALPAYITGYVALIVGLLLTTHIPGLLAFALLYAALLMVASAWLFKSSFWVYPATALLALSLLTTLGQAVIPLERHGWWLIGLAAIYLSAGWLLKRFKLDAYASAIINVAFMLIALGLPPSSRDRVGAFWGYGSAALLYIVSAFWLQQPLLLAAACALIVVPYASALQQSPLDARYYGLALFPGAVISLGIATLLDARRGAWRDFPWQEPSQWFTAFAERMLGWWGLSFYLLGFGLATMAPFFAAGHSDLISLSFFLLAACYTWAIFRFRGRFWLWGSALALHLAAGFFLAHQGFGAPRFSEFWLRFLPMTILTMALALWLEKRFNEGSPFDAEKFYTGWSRPLYFFVLADFVFGQLVSVLHLTSPASLSITLVHTLLIGVLASAWGAPLLVYVSTLLGLIALFQWRSSQRMPLDGLSVQMAWLALGYGFFGFGYRLFLRWQSAGEATNSQPRWLSIWELPLQRSAMLLSTLSLVLVPLLGIELIGWSVSALLGISFRDAVEPKTVWMAIWTFSLVGLLYTAASAVYWRLRLGYLAIGLLLTSWFLYAFYINNWENLPYVQWYAMPAGLYLLAISYVEWTRGNKRFARWLDYAAMLLMMGSLFWQTLSLGLLFCVILILESLFIFGWGMVRRLRRFFYTGIAGVLLAVLGQLVNGLQNANSWIIWGSLGLLIVLVGILVERRLEAIKAWDQRVLETWE